MNFAGYVLAIGKITVKKVVTHTTAQTRKMINKGNSKFGLFSNEIIVKYS